MEGTGAHAREVIATLTGSNIDGATVEGLDGALVDSRARLDVAVHLLAVHLALFGRLELGLGSQQLLQCLHMVFLPPLLPHTPDLRFCFVAGLLLRIV
jgi:hypothetical protein